MKRVFVFALFALLFSGCAQRPPKGRGAAATETRPISAVDPFGLDLWSCMSPAFGIIGFNHVYMWDDSDNPRYNPPQSKPRDCAMQSSSGSGPTHEKGTPGPPSGLGDGFDVWYGERKGLPVTCTRVPNSNGKEPAAMDCCETKANNGMFFPGVNDCHTPFDKCLIHAGIPPDDIPPHPRVGGGPR